MLTFKSPILFFSFSLLCILMIILFPRDLSRNYYNLSINVMYQNVRVIHRRLIFSLSIFYNSDIFAERLNSIYPNISINKKKKKKKERKKEKSCFQMLFERRSKKFRERLNFKSGWDQSRGKVNSKKNYTCLSESTK